MPPRIESGSGRAFGEPWRRPRRRTVNPPASAVGSVKAVELAPLFPTRHTVTTEELALAQEAWAAFRSPDPTALAGLLGGDTSALPFLRAALVQHLEEFPSMENGLSRTERELLEVLASGNASPCAIFTAWQAKEDSLFMGDLPLWAHLRQLSAGPHPLVARADGGSFRMPTECTSAGEFAAQRLVLTEAGRTVLARAADQLDLRGIDRWLGSVHLQSGASLWRWQARLQQLVPA